MAQKESFKLKILKINESLFDGEAQSVTLPGIGGDMTVLAGHEALVTLLKKGVIVVKTEEGEKTFDIERGYFETTQDQTSVLLS